MENLKLYPTSRLRGKIVLPASKSISARALIINALSGSDLLPQNLSDSDDTRAMLRGLQSSSESPLRGARSKEQGAREHQLPEQASCSLPPCPLPLKKEGRRDSVIDIGAAGTAMRFLTAFLSVTPGEYVITGTERMRQRPISILVDALRQLGADIAYEGEEGFPPLRIVGKAGLEGGQLTVAGNVSSQYISALMMIAPTRRKGLRLTLTGRIASRPVIEVQPGTYTQRPYHIESDWSAASYWYEMVAVAPDTEAEVELTGLHRDSIQGDSKVREMFRHLGVETTFFHEDDGTEAVRLKRSGKPCPHLELDFIGQPDLAQTLIVTCTLLGTTFRFSGLASLKIKETDRTAALQTELRKLGFVVHEDGESVVWWDGERCQAEAAPAFDTYEDHRMAMSLAPACLRFGREIQINNPKVVSKSYPAFWDDLKKAGTKIV